MAAGMRGGLGLVSWILLGGGLVMMWFVVLAGVSNVSPLNKIYFLQADTSNISGAQFATSQWTYFYICGPGNSPCGSASPALPFGAAWGSSATGVPSELIGDYGNGTTSFYYWYVWRFGWVFYLIGLFFGVVTVFTGLLSCTRLGSGFSSLMAMLASFFTTLAAILMTVEFVKARDVFIANNRTASIGSYAFGFTWAATICLFLAAVLFFGGCFIGRDKSSDHVSSRKGGFFRRNRSTRSRGSFIDNESQRRVVKEEYS